MVTPATGLPAPNPRKQSLGPRVGHRYERVRHLDRNVEPRREPTLIAGLRQAGGGHDSHAFGTVVHETQHRRGLVLCPNSRQTSPTKSTCH